LSGTLTVQVQVAVVSWNNDLPACVSPGESFDLDPLTSIGGISEDLIQRVFSASDGQPLPNGVALDINQNTGVLSVTAAAQTPQNVVLTVKVFGTAGLLDEAEATISVEQFCGD
jgi:hypothetical protein